MYVRNAFMDDYFLLMTFVHAYYCSPHLESSSAKSLPPPCSFKSVLIGVKPSLFDNRNELYDTQPRAHMLGPRCCGRLTVSALRCREKSSDVQKRQSARLAVEPEYQRCCAAGCFHEHTTGHAFGPRFWRYRHIGR